MRYFLLIFFLAVVALVSIAGWRGQKSALAPVEIFPDMDRQGKVKAQSESVFFADGRSARPPVVDTVPIGYDRPRKSNPEIESLPAGFSQSDDYLNTGKIDPLTWGSGFPIKVDLTLLQRGQERYAIYCAVCHGATGAGNGITTQYGMVAMANYHQARIREMADGEIYDTITHGKNTMMPYGDKITVQDRWAIIAYIRALQRAENGTVADVPPEDLKLLEGR